MMRLGAGSVGKVGSPQRSEAWLGPLSQPSQEGWLIGQKRLVEL